MGRASCLIPAMAMAAFPAAAEATVVTFDDVPIAISHGLSAPLPPGYGGIDWAPDFGAYVANSVFVPESGTQVALTNYLVTDDTGHFATIGFSFAGPVRFDGMFVAFNLVLEEGMSYRMLLDGVVKATVAIDPIHYNGAYAYGYYASDYAGPVDRVEIVGQRGFYTIDDVTYSAVPEPAEWATILAGLGMVGATVRRRRATVRFA